MMLHISTVEKSNMHPFFSFSTVVVKSSELEFASPESYYQKLVNSSKFSYTYWSPKCRGELFSFDTFVVASV